MEDKRAVQNFQEYLRIKSVQPNPDYDSCIAWVKKQGDELNLEFNIVRFPKPAEFTVWLTWKGKNPDLKSIMLNSHMDVVPVNYEKWTTDPFAAEIYENGNIYGRGTQDMKSVGVQYLEAIRRLKAKGFTPLRTIHVTFVPDEELGGKKGMAEFVKTKEFLGLNVGVELDEGGAWPFEDFLVFYGERAFWQFNFKINGHTGHALMFIEDTVGEKLQKVLDIMLKLREDEKARLAANKNLALGDVTTLNMTMIKGGVQPNVLPSEMSVTFDMRVTPNWGQSEAEKFLDDVCKEAGPGISYKFITRSNVIANTDLDDERNVWWKEFKASAESLNIKVTPQICPGATDARYLRELGIPAFGFSPMNLTPVLLHDNDEFLNEKTFLRGIEIYMEIIQRFASVLS